MYAHIFAVMFIQHQLHCHIIYMEEKYIQLFCNTGEYVVVLCTNIKLFSPTTAEEHILSNVPTLH